MDESTKTNGDSIGTFLVGTAGSLALVGSLYSFWMMRKEQQKRRRNRFAAILDNVNLPDERDIARSRALMSKELNRAGKATARGLNAGLSAAWDVAVGGADAVRTRARVVPTILSSVSEAGASLGNAVGHAGMAMGTRVGHAGVTAANTVSQAGTTVGQAGSTVAHAAQQAGGATRSFIGTTARAAMWLSLLGSALVYIYLPDPNQRDRFFARVRGYYDGIAGGVQSARGSRNYGT